jgi:class 3 adenylate cyclase
MADEDVELVWRGPFASLPRAMDVGMVRALATAAGTFAALAALALLPVLAGWTRVAGSNKAGLTVVFVGALMAAALQFALRASTPRQMASLHPNTISVLFVLSSLMVGGVVVFSGPSFGSVAVFAVIIPLLAFFALRTPWAVAVTAFSLASYAVALALLDHPPSPIQQFINVVASAGAAGVLIGGLASRLDLSRRQLADFNHNLEARVSRQVDELERAGRLRRFLSPQVADVVTSEGADEMLAPHRRDIAVFFVDLRGFTAFTNAVAAERVMRVLEEYYEAVGLVLDRYGATIGGFDGDGIFAYLGDPVPRDDAPGAVVEMGQEVARCLDGLTARWSGDGAGAPLGYGIGAAYGEATLGLIGFSNRADYTPVGAVVNLAARLCAEAKHAEIVVDSALRKAAELHEQSVTRRADVELKGFGVTETYAVIH